MFRRERPQKAVIVSSIRSVASRLWVLRGRDIDAGEIIAMSADLWEKLGIREYLTGNQQPGQPLRNARHYRAALVEYLPAKRTERTLNAV